MAERERERKKERNREREMVFSRRWGWSVGRRAAAFSVRQVSDFSPSRQARALGASARQLPATLRFTVADRSPPSQHHRHLFLPPKKKKKQNKTKFDNVDIKNRQETFVNNNTHQTCYVCFDGRFFFFSFSSFCCCCWIC